MTEEAVQRLHAATARLLALEGCELYTYFPESGPVRRELYPRHMDHFKAGAQHRQRLFMAANRVGKTRSGAYEVAAHATGEYPSWWTGRVFPHRIDVWAAGKDTGTTKNILQKALVGAVGEDGTLSGGGMIPLDRVIHATRKPHNPGALDTVWVRHNDGGTSIIQFKSYEQGSKSFEGTEQHIVWFDEEPPLSCYSEAVVRTMTTSGLMIVTFTPLQGMSDVVSMFVSPAPEAAQYLHLTTAGWDHVPHLGEAEKAELLATTPPFQRDARSQGIPQLGSGAVWAFPESELRIPNFEIPPHWNKCFGLDVGGGAKATAAVWLAIEPSAGGRVIVTDSYKRESPEPAVHLSAIRARGEGIPGSGDAAALIVTAGDAEQLIRVYQRGGLDLELADKSVEAGIASVWQLFSDGRLKVFASCTEWWDEWRMYQRDAKGRIVKKNDHCMDATRYAIYSGIKRARPVTTKAQQRRVAFNRGRVGGSGSWMGS